MILFSEYIFHFQVAVSLVFKLLLFSADLEIQLICLCRSHFALPGRLLHTIWSTTLTEAKALGMQFWTESGSLSNYITIYPLLHKT